MYRHVTWTGVLTTYLLGIRIVCLLLLARLLNEVWGGARRGGGALFSVQQLEHIAFGNRLNTFYSSDSAKYFVPLMYHLWNCRWFIVGKLWQNENEINKTILNEARFSNQSNRVVTCELSRIPKAQWFDYMTGLMKNKICNETLVVR